MVSSVTSAPYYSYLNQLTGNTTPAPAPATTTPATTTVAAPTAPTGNTAQSLVSSLLGNGNGFSSEVLSLLQENSAGSFDPITSLLGGTSTNNALTSIYANLYASVAAAALTSAQENNTPQATTPPAANSAVNLINAQTQASVAYNQTLQQNAANVISANSYGPDGVTPLVA